MNDIVTLEPDMMGGRIAVRGGALEGGLLTPELVTELEGQIKLVKRMRLAVCQLTEPAHWRDIGGKPYLMDGGVHAIASTIGVEFSKPEITEERGSDPDGEFIHYRCVLSGSWRGRMLHEEGTSSTRDDLWKKTAFTEINLGNVRKKSITNAQHRVLNKIAGIGGTTWELLSSIGIHRGDGGTTRYKGSEGKMSTGSGVWGPEKERLWAMLLELNNRDDAAAEDNLFRLTDNPGKGYKGYRDIGQVSSGTMKWLLPHVEKHYKKATEERQEAGELPQVKDPGADREPGSDG
jgi:hypothetical protein